MTSELYSNKILSNLNVRKNSYDGLTIELVTLDVFEYGDIGILYENKYAKKINLSEVDPELTLFLIMYIGVEVVFTNEYARFLYKGFIDNQTWDLNINDILCLSPVKGRFTANLQQNPLVPVGIVLEKTKIYFDGIKKFSKSNSTTTPTPQYTDYIINPSNITPSSSYSDYVLPTNLSINEPILIGNISISSTQYIILNDQNQVIYDSGELSGIVNSINISNISVPYGLLKWKARYKDSNNRWCSYSQPTNINYIRPFISFGSISYPSGSIIGRILSITLPTPIINGPITCTAYQVIIKDSLNNIVYNSNEQNYTTSTIVTSIFLSTGNYTISNRFKSSINIWSDWNTPTSFFVKEIDWLDYDNTKNGVEQKISDHATRILFSSKHPTRNAVLYATSKKIGVLEYTNNTVVYNRLATSPSSYSTTYNTAVSTLWIDDVTILVAYNNSNTKTQYFTTMTYDFTNHAFSVLLEYAAYTFSTFPTVSPFRYDLYKLPVSSYYFYICIYCDDNNICVGYFVNYGGNTLAASRGAILKLVNNSGIIYSFCSAELFSHNYIAFIYDNVSNQNKLIFIQTSTVEYNITITFSDWYVSFSSTIKASQLTCKPLNSSTVLLVYKNENELNSPIYARLITDINTVNKTFTIQSPILINFTTISHPNSKTYLTQITSTDILLFDGAGVNLGVIKYNSTTNNIVFYEKTSCANNFPISNISTTKRENNCSILALSETKLFMGYTDSEYSDYMAIRFLNLY